MREIKNKMTDKEKAKRKGKKKRKVGKSKKKKKIKKIETWREKIEERERRYIDYQNRIENRMKLDVLMDSRQ